MEGVFEVKCQHTCDLGQHTCDFAVLDQHTCDHLGQQHSVHGSLEGVSNIESDIRYSIHGVGWCGVVGW